MYKNVGHTLQKWALVCFTIGVVFLLMGVFMVVLCLELLKIELSVPIFLLGLIIIALIALALWMGYLLLFGFGELIVRTTEIAENTYPGNFITSDATEANTADE